ncbi:translation initiation factor 2 [Eggerthella sinensis]|uniref:translation initiation factor 2 n=1 Tax=Eggerthella sinensis TaxID=242230 RepID=UPI00266B5098|nr:translation initiation factor 2 [Eggerthella sinensis]
MSNAALAPELSPAPSRQVRGAHARPARTVEVRVIPGGLIAEQGAPRHAKATLLDSLQGTGFNLSARERACAIAFGALFALAALAVVLL